MAVGPNLVPFIIQIKCNTLTKIDIDCVRYILSIATIAYGEKKLFCFFSVDRRTLFVCFCTRPYFIFLVYIVLLFLACKEHIHIFTRAHTLARKLPQQPQSHTDYNSMHHRQKKRICIARYRHILGSLYR